MARSATAPDEALALITGTAAGAGVPPVPARARPVHGPSADPLQTVLDSIKEAVLTVGEDGRILSFNLTAERVFGYAEAQARALRIEELLPQLADRGAAAEALERLSASTGDTRVDLAARELRGRRQSGELFAAEITVGRAAAVECPVFVVCLRDISARRDSERALRESEERYRMLVDHAPEAIVMLDADSGLFVDVNANAERLFGYSRAQLLQRGTHDVSPPFQPDGARASSPTNISVRVQRALAGQPQTFEWVHLHSSGRLLECEVCLVRIPGGSGRLVRGSIMDISERKREQRREQGEREVLDRLTAGAPVPAVLESITHLVEWVDPGSLCSVSLLSGNGAGFASVIAPRLGAQLRALLSGVRIAVGHGSCAAAVYLSRPVLVADLAKDPFWSELRPRICAAGLRAAWSVPIKAADGRVLGALGVYRPEMGVPTDAEVASIARAAQLAGLAVERLLADEALIAAKERAQVTLRSIGDGVITTCARGLVDYLNPVAEKLTCWTLEEARGRPVQEVLRLIDEITRAPLELSLAGMGRQAPGQPVLVTRSGQEVAVQETATPIRDGSGAGIGTVIVIHDVTQERRLKRALAYQASHDVLTGLINRREFDVRLRDALNAARRGTCSALLYVDLDQFKIVNDTCGHEAGDRLLRDLTALLRSRLGTQDTIARLGGDEFGILLGGRSLDQAAAVAELVRAAIQNHRFAWNANVLSVGASVGVVEINAETANAAATLTAADLACYAAKEEGRNRVRIYDDRGSGGHRRQMHWAARVTRAVEEDRLELFFQPIVPVGSCGLPTFHEITVQLRDEDGRLVPPGEFIPAAERYNVMSSVDRWVLLQVIEVLGAARGDPAAPLFAVNVSGTSLSDQGFRDFVAQHAGRAEVAGRLCFEVTETAAVTNWAAALEFMKHLHTRGCRFSLDDFGSGMSSFMYLRTLPVDFLKIDGQFVRPIASNPIDRCMVEAICRIGRSLGIRTVAECVEDAATFEVLRDIGADFVQGYHLARPRPLGELIRPPPQAASRRQRLP